MTKCIKCKTEDSTIDIKFAVYCSACFLEATYHKYRTLLARTRDASSSSGLILLPRGPVSPASKLLIHFSQLPVIEEPARRNVIRYHIAIPVENRTEFNNLVEFAQQLKQSYTYPSLGEIYILPLGMKVEEFRLLSASDNVPEDLLNVQIGNLSSTLVEDILNYRLLHLQLELMKVLNESRAITSDTSTALASQIISSTCKGRGKYLPWDSALSRQFPDNKFISRPLKEVSDREVAIYCNESAGTYIFSAINDSISKKSGNSSIDALTDAFITNLDNENPGTANVVIRTSGKISTTMTDSKTTTCKICHVPEETEDFCYSCKAIEQVFFK